MVIQDLCKLVRVLDRRICVPIVLVRLKMLYIGVAANMLQRFLEEISFSRYNSSETHRFEKYLRL